MLRIHRHIKSYLIGKYHAFQGSDNSFVVMMFCNRLIGFFDNSGSHRDRLCLVKCACLTLAIIYTLLETGSILFFKSFNIAQHFEFLFMTFGRMLCVIMWTTLAVHRHDLKQVWTYLLDLQRNSPDERRRKYIRTVNWLTLIFLMLDLFPAVVWAITGRAGSPLSLYENDLIDKLNSIFNPIVVFVLTFMFCYSIVVVCTIIPALTLEFQMLGTDFERIYEDVGSLEETVRCAANHWDKLEQAFISCVERHQSLLNTAVAFRRQLKTYFLIQLAIIFIAIVLSTFMYVVGQRNDDSSFAFCAFGSIAHLSNLLLYGFLCDQLEGQVSAINYHLYCSGWTDKLIYSRAFGRRYKNFRKMILIVMARTQKKIGFTCGNFFEMSLITCRKVLWFAYSVLALLMSLLE